MPGGNLLVEARLAPIPYAMGGVGLPGGEVLREWGKYYEVTEAGELVREWKEPTHFSLEDELFVGDIYRVVDGALYRFTRIEQWGYEGEVHVYGPEVTGLVEVETQ